MKQIVSNYTYSPTSNCVTLTGLNIDQDQLLLIVAPEQGRTLYNFASVTGSVVPGANTRINLTASTAGLTTTSPLVIFYDDQSSTQTIAGTVTVGALPSIATEIESGLNNYAANYNDSLPIRTDNPLPISGTVTVGNQPTLVSFPDAQLGTVTAAPVYLARGAQSGVGWATLQGIFFDLSENGEGVPISLPSGVTGIGVIVTNSVTIGSLPAISGTVTANLSSVPTHGVTIANSSVTVNGTFYQATQPVSLTSTTVTVSALPSGALTTRFGSVTTANLSQLTSCVTNTSRKYLLAQNISTGTVTIGIGFSPTTTQGIQLTAGAGLTFDAFCPTGAVYWLGATTGATWTILEG